MKILLIVGVAVLIIGGVIWGLEQSAPLFAPAGSPQALSSDETADLFTSGGGATLRWQGGAINTRFQNIPPHQSADQVVYLGPAKESVVAVRVSDPSAQVALTSPSGLVVPAAQAILATDEATGETIVTYPLTDVTESGEWHVTVNNPQAAATTTVSVSTPEAKPPLAVTDTTPSLNQSDTTITLSLTVEESVSDGPDIVVKTVSGATVTAVVTAPDGTETTVTLTEDPNNPGTYTGDLPGDHGNGVYTVEYVITGVNNEGQPFTQITTGQFVVTGGAGTSSSTPEQWNKKYDINRSGEVNIIGY